MLTWLRRRMPLDGRGWERPDELQRLLFRTAAGSVRRRLPAPVSGLVLAGARAGWLPFAFSAAWTYARQPGRRTPLAPLFLDCLMTGARPREAWLWRELFGERIEIGSRAGSLLLRVLGEPDGHQLLADKAATARALRAAGVPVPETLAIIGPHSTEEDLQPVRRASAGLFIKPQSGFGGQWRIVAEPLAADRWWVNGAAMSWEDFSAGLRGAGRPLLAQPRLHGARWLEGLSDAERPPVLRITTARRPGGAPFLYGALLSIPVPGDPGRDFMTKVVRAPADPASGRLAAGVLFASPRQRLSTAPWNQARIQDRVLEGVPDAVQATLAAAAAVPPLPVVGWDVVMTDAGPIILEGNSMTNWVLPRFSRAPGQDASLLPLLAEWAAAAEALRS
jgi:hypothetical protein